MHRRAKGALLFELVCVTVQSSTFDKAQYMGALFGRADRNGECLELAHSRRRVVAKIRSSNVRCQRYRDHWLAAQSLLAFRKARRERQTCAKRRKARAPKRDKNRSAARRSPAVSPRGFYM